MNVITEEIKAAIQKELAGANERFPLFSSLHEAYAVISEESDEALDAMKHFSDMFMLFWKAVKQNNAPVAIDCIARAKHAAENLAIEACHVAAMCEKSIQSHKAKEAQHNDG